MKDKDNAKDNIKELAELTKADIEWRVNKLESSYETIKETVNLLLSEPEKKKVFFDNILNYVKFIIEDEFLKSVITQEANKDYSRNNILELLPKCKEELSHTKHELFDLIKQKKLYNEEVKLSLNNYYHFQEVVASEISFVEPIPEDDLFYNSIHILFKSLISDIVEEYNLLCNIIISLPVTEIDKKFIGSSIERGEGFLPSIEGEDPILDMSYTDNSELYKGYYWGSLDNNIKNWLKFIQEQDIVFTFSPTYPKLIKEYYAHFTRQIIETLWFAWDRLEKVYDTRVRRTDIINQLEEEGDHYALVRFSQYDREMEQIIIMSEHTNPNKLRLYETAHYIAYIDRVHNFLIPELKKRPEEKYQVNVITDIQKNLLVGPEIVREESKLEPKFPHKLPSGTEWKNITIIFLNDVNVLIKVKGFEDYTDYNKMGFADGRKNLAVTDKPYTEAWVLLKTLAEKGGELTIKDPAAKDTWKKQKELLTNALQSYFSLDTDPFDPYHSNRSYKVKITLFYKTKSETQPKEENGLTKIENKLMPHPPREKKNR